MKSTSGSIGPLYFVITSKTSQPATVASYIGSPVKYQGEKIKASHVAALSNNVVVDEEAGFKITSPPFRQITSHIAENINTFIEKLEPFTYLSNGWDGRDSRAPTQNALVAALRDSLQLLTIGLPVPNPKALSDGTLGIFWEDGLSYAAIDFEDDGVHVWTITNGKDFKSGTWDAQAEVPEDFRAVLPSQNWLEG